MRRLAVGCALVLAAQNTALGAKNEPWCTGIPLPRATACRAFVVRTPRATLRLAVAATEAQREHGLMGVPLVPAGEGMLFAFPDGDAPRGFWMKNTIASLDMIFVRGDGIVTSIAADVPATVPGTADDAVAKRDGFGRYVIELAAGEAARLKLRVGERLAIAPVAAR